VSEDQPGAAPPPRAGEGAPSEEELRAALEEQMRRLTVSDVLLQTVVTLVNLAGRRLGLARGPEAAAERDLDQARVAIEAVRALLPLLPGEESASVRDALSQLQMAYAREAKQGPPGEGPGEGASEQPAKPGTEKAAKEQAERAKARSKIWTPPGS
jgi:hypothetical protein